MTTLAHIRITSRRTVPRRNYRFFVFPLGHRGEESDRGHGVKLLLFRVRSSSADECIIIKKRIHFQTFLYDGRSTGTYLIFFFFCADVCLSEVFRVDVYGRLVSRDIGRRRRGRYLRVTVFLKKIVFYCYYYYYIVITSR